MSTNNRDENNATAVNRRGHRGAFAHAYAADVEPTTRRIAVYQAQVSTEKWVSRWRA